MSSEEPAFRAEQSARRESSDASTFEHWVIFVAIGVGMALGCAALLMRLA